MHWLYAIFNSYGLWMWHYDSFWSTCSKNLVSLSINNTNIYRVVLNLGPEKYFLIAIVLFVPLSWLNVVPRLHNNWPRWNGNKSYCLCEYTCLILTYVLYQWQMNDGATKLTVNGCQVREILFSSEIVRCHHISTSGIESAFRHSVVSVHKCQFINIECHISHT